MGKLILGITVSVVLAVIMAVVTIAEISRHHQAQTNTIILPIK